MSLIASVLFLVLLESAVFLTGGYFWLSALGALALSFYVIWRVDFVKKSAFLVLAALLVLIAVSLLSVSRNIIFSQIIISVASLIFYALASGYLARNTAAAALVSFVELLAVVFLLLAHQAASAVSGWVVGPLLFVVVFALFFFSIFSAIDFKKPLMIRLLCFSLLAGIIVTEFYFALSRLPFNLLSIDFLVFIIYYGLWDISLRYFSLRLTKNILLFDVLLVLLSFVFIFSSAKWFPNLVKSP